LTPRTQRRTRWRRSSHEVQVYHVTEEEIQLIKEGHITWGHQLNQADVIQD